MPYADPHDVLARAGSLKQAFADGQPVASAEIETFLTQTAGEIDASIAAHGFPVPVVDEAAARALTAVNADMALILALDANWPGSGPQGVDDLRASVQTRVDGYRQALAGGTLAALLYLGALASAGAQDDVGGASSFWTEDSQTYEWWQRWYSTRMSWWTDPWGVPNVEQPPFRRDMAL